MSSHLLGQTFALLAAMTWATALVLFKRSGESVSPLALNLFKNVVGIACTALTLVALAAWTLLHENGHLSAVFGWDHTGDICILMLSGIIGITFADTIFFYSLNYIGVGLFSIVDCLYSPAVLFCAWLLLGEQLAWHHYVGGGLILTGVFISSKHPPPPDRTTGQILLGIILAAVAVSSMAIGIVMAKPVLEAYDPLWSALLRLVAGTVLLALLTPLLPRGSAFWSVFRPAPVWRYSIPAAFLGTFLAMVFWVAGFKYTHASIAAILNQTSIVFALILATLFLRERFTKQKAAAVVLAFAGVLVITGSNAVQEWQANRANEERAGRRTAERAEDTAMSDTNAVKWLRAQGVAFDVLTYEFTTIGAEHAAAAVDEPLEAVCKTLVVRTTGKNYHLAIVPGDQRFDPKRMAKALGEAEVDLAPSDEAEKITGYQVGGISPFAQRRRLPVVIEESLLALDELVVNGGKRGVLVKLATADVVKLLAATPADIVELPRQLAATPADIGVEPASRRHA